MADAPLILIAEDKKNISQRLDAAFKALGFRTLVCAHGGEALEVMRARGAEVNGMVLDYEMRGTGSDATRRLNGDEFLRALLAENLPLPPTVLYTAEPSNALPAMHDVLGVAWRDYSATEPKSAGEKIAGNGPVTLSRHSFADIGHRRSVAVVTKSVSVNGDMADILSHLQAMGVPMPDAPGRPGRPDRQAGRGWELP